MNRELPRVLVALASGLIFGFGLSLSGMVDPVRVQGVLDLFGHWDPSLIFVLAGAVIVAFVGVSIMRRWRRPVFDAVFHLPETKPIDRRLMIGSAVFGIGWGMAGLCPGPALAALSLGLPQVPLFVAAMLIGMVAHDRWAKKVS
ncbi:YeeE/YedE family protein [Rhizobium hainanense]|uniref:Sulphur transport domain-containing protein n=1 Tax=Rhizobium hainanense TaxID=52131 RepID=A0A1C3V984_9HYPH|nr:YeeE/YedE family protein [Rhizobium hainanense]SCB24219.1 hypothetical protein GA0061100_10518 [Rhizobium hainanense]